MLTMTAANCSPFLLLDLFVEGLLLEKLKDRSGSQRKFTFSNTGRWVTG